MANSSHKRMNKRKLFAIRKHFMEWISFNVFFNIWRNHTVQRSVFIASILLMEEVTEREREIEIESVSQKLLSCLFADSCGRRWLRELHTDQARVRWMTVITWMNGAVGCGGGGWSPASSALCACIADVLFTDNVSIHDCGSVIAIRVLMKWPSSTACTIVQ